MALSNVRHLVQFDIPVWSNMLPWVIRVCRQFVECAFFGSCKIFCGSMICVFITWISMSHIPVFAVGVVVGVFRISLIMLSAYQVYSVVRSPLLLLGSMLLLHRLLWDYTCVQQLPYCAHFYVMEFFVSSEYEYHV